jgi:hypothetical protein
MSGERRGDCRAQSTHFLGPFTQGPTAVAEESRRFFGREYLEIYSYIEDFVLWQCDPLRLLTRSLRHEYFIVTVA